MIFILLCYAFRYAITKAFIISFLMTFFSMFDVPVFWPILLCYWFVLFTLTMKRQIMHMIKYRYIPFSIGKQVIIELLPYAIPKFSNKGSIWRWQFWPIYLKVGRTGFESPKVLDECFQPSKLNFLNKLI